MVYSNQIRDRQAEKQLNELLQVHDLSPELRVYNQCSSTMDAARELTDAGLVIAKTQTAGRGRQGRAWNSAAHGLYATLALPYSGNLQHLSGVSLFTGCILARVLTQTAAPVRLKWPNDIQALDGRKLAGILIEAPGAGSSPRLLIGFGINLEGEIKDLPEAVFLSEICDKPPSYLQLAAAIYAELAQSFPVFIEQGFAAFKAEWLELASWLIHSDVRINLGQEVLIATALGISDGGELLVAHQGKERLISVGDVSAL